MRIQVTWNRSDGSRHSVDMPETRLYDLDYDDVELLLAGAKTAAIVHFKEKLGETPALNQLVARLMK